MIKIEEFEDRAALVKAIENICMELPDELLKGWVRWEAGSEIMIVDDPKTAEMDRVGFKGGLGSLLEIDGDRIGDIMHQKRRLEARARAAADGLSKAEQKKAMDRCDEPDDIVEEDIAGALAELLALLMNNLPLLTGSKQIRDEP